MNPLLLTDGYKTGHHLMYPEGTTLVYSNFTPRSNKYAPKRCDQLVSFGQQMTMLQIHEAFEQNFFSKPKDEVCNEMKEELEMYLGMPYDVSHFEALHDLGYLPIKVKIIEEGSLVPIRVPVLTICNTHPDFYWITNYLETIISNMLWKPMTSASIAYTYRKLLTKWQERTDKENGWFIDWQGHDFSMRGLDSIDAVVSSGLGHLTSFMGTDSLPTIHGARKYYAAEGPVGGSVPATEHSVMCAGSKESEVETFRRLLQTYPKGILSVVSDTWDLWKVCTEHVVALKEEILARDGKLVIRPDSGDPVDIICGSREFYKLWHKIKNGYETTVISGYYDVNKIYYDKENYYKVEILGSVGVDQLKYKFWKIELDDPSKKGVIELLWDVFGGTINEQGYKVLDPHIGAIYGDSITLDRADEICSRLEAKGFASTNIVLGIGSFTYQFNTRDTFGFAMKATYVIVNGVGQEIFKDPITDDGIKKSAKGLLRVNEDMSLSDQVTRDEEGEGMLKTLYVDGMFESYTDFKTIKSKLNG
jgi:nicotinamide phosphoribosyltransferase